MTRLDHDTTAVPHDYDTVNGLHLPPGHTVDLPTPPLELPLLHHPVRYDPTPGEIQQGQGDGCSFAAAAIALQYLSLRHDRCALIRCHWCGTDDRAVVQEWFVNGSWRRMRVVVSSGVFDANNNRLDCSIDPTGASCWATAAERVHMFLGHATRPATLNAILGQVSNAASVLHHLTGWPAETINAAKVDASILQKLSAALADGRCVACVGTTPYTGPTQDGLLPNHAYALLACCQLRAKICFQLQNPWSDATCHAKNIANTCWIAGGHPLLSHIHVAWDLDPDDETTTINPTDRQTHHLVVSKDGPVEVFLTRHYCNRRELEDQYLSMTLGSTSTTYTAAECSALRVGSAAGTVHQLTVRGHPQKQPLHRYSLRLRNARLA